MSEQRMAMRYEPDRGVIAKHHEVRRGDGKWAIVETYGYDRPPFDAAKLKGEK